MRRDHRSDTSALDTGGKRSISDWNLKQSGWTCTDAPGDYMVGKMMFVIASCMAMLSVQAVEAAECDIAAGEKVFRKCRACHKADEDKNGVGPSLYGVIGRDKGSVEGFKYSDAMMAAEGTWTASDLDAYLADPKGFIPGNRMSFPGLKDQKDRIDVITYLNQADGSPEPLN